MKKPQRERILEILEEMGEKGVHSFTLATTIGLRAAARINDLRKEGHVITSKPEKMGDSYGVRYTLQ